MPHINQSIQKSFFVFFCSTVLFSLVFLETFLQTNFVTGVDWLSWIYIIPSAVGHASLFALVAFLVGYIPFFIFRKPNIGLWVFIVLLFFIQFFLVLDGFVFKLYRFHFNGFVISLIWGGGTEIFEIKLWTYLQFFGLIFLVGVLPLLLIYWLVGKYSSFISKKNIVKISLLLLFCITYSHIFHAVAAVWKDAGIQKASTVMPYFFPLTANTLLWELGVVQRDEIDNLSYNEFSSDIQYPVKSLHVTNPEKPLNILFILLDSWNPSTFNAEVTPNIYSFAKEGNFFMNHYSSSNGTQGSMAALFFGIPYTYKRELFISKMSPLLIDRLIELDYDIQTFPSATLLSPPFNEMIFRRVPSVMTDANGQNSFERDIDITKKFLSYLETKEDNQPFFSFLFYDLPHAISIPEEHRNQFTPSWSEPKYLELNNKMDPTPFFNLYKNCVYYDDILIGSVLDAIKQKGLLENTIIIITGDHGQEFNENQKNYWGHSANYTKWQIQVPFILYYPEIQSGHEYQHMTTHYDLVPTLMNRFLGVNNPSEDYSTGYDIYESNSRYPHIVGNDIEYGFLFDNMIITTNHIGTMEITDGSLNALPRSAVNASQLQEAIQLKNRFYK